MEIIHGFYKGSTNFNEYKKTGTKDIHKRYQQKKRPRRVSPTIRVNQMVKVPLSDSICNSPHFVPGQQPEPGPLDHR